MGSIFTPAGSFDWMSATFARTARTTSRLFAPVSIIAMPVTASPSPSRVITPCRSAAPTRTFATCRTSTGVPSGSVCKTTFAMSSSHLRRPTPTSVYDSSGRSR